MRLLPIPKASRDHPEGLPLPSAHIFALPMMHHKLWALLPLILFQPLGEGRRRQDAWYRPVSGSPARSLHPAADAPCRLCQPGVDAAGLGLVLHRLQSDGPACHRRHSHPGGTGPRPCDDQRWRVVARDREKTFDGNTVTSVYVMGDDAFIQYDWTGMAVATRSLRLNAWAAYREQQADGGYEIVVEASPDGAAWQEIGALRGEDLPGKAMRRRQPPIPTSRRLSSVCRCA